MRRIVAALLASACVAAVTVLAVGRADERVTTVVYDVYAGDGGPVRRVAAVRFVIRDWDHWFHMVEASGDQAALGVWEHFRSPVVTHGKLAVRPVPGVGGPALPEVDLRPRPLRARSQYVESHDLRHRHAVHPDTGVVTDIEFDGLAPNSLVNTRFTALRGLPDHRPAARGEIAALVPSGGGAFGRAVRAPAPARVVAELSGVRGARGGAVVPTACSRCDRLVAVWDPRTRLPLLAAEISPEGHLIGVLAVEVRPATSGELAALESHPGERGG